MCMCANIYIYIDRYIYISCIFICDILIAYNSLITF